MTADIALRITLRAVGRLLVAGIVTREMAAAWIRWAWVKNAAELMPSGSTSTDEFNRTFAAAEGNDHWCGCGYYRVQAEGTLCPSCLDDERRGAA